LSKITLFALFSLITGANVSPAQLDALAWVVPVAGQYRGNGF